MTSPQTSGGDGLTSARSSAGQRPVTETIYRLLAWARAVLGLHALIVNSLRLHEAAHPYALLIAMLAIIAGTMMIIRIWLRPNLLDKRWIAADVIITLVIVLASRLVLGAELLAVSYLGIAAYWAVGPALIISVWRGPLIGAAVGALFGLAQFLQAPSLDPRAWSDVLIMAALPYFVGAFVVQIAVSVKDRDQILATAAALAERERLNRIVHDGVLQLLAMVSREGSELGPRGQMLAVLARKQEDQLRATLQDKTVDVTAGGTLDVDRTDLTTMLERHQNNRITVSTMADEIYMETGRAKELDRVITEVLSNVVKHAGPDARAWILLEQENPAEVLISVRDDGIGMSREVLKSAADAGRMGVKESIVGRMLDLGGTSTVHSALGEGTEWEFRLPIEAPTSVRARSDRFEV